MRARNSPRDKDRTSMRLAVLAAAAVVVLAVPLAPAAAAPIFSQSTPGLYSTTLAPGTYDIVATGAGGGNAMATPAAVRNLGGLGAVVEGLFTFTTPETLSILVGGRGGTGMTGPGGGGGGTFVIGAGNTPLLIAGGGGGGGNSSTTNGGNGRGIEARGGEGGGGGDYQSRGGGGGGGGGGLTGNGDPGKTGSQVGDPGAYPGGGGGAAFVNGGAGGISGRPVFSGDGGVGGGGGGGFTGGGGGGGGFSGGDGAISFNLPPTPGGGGLGGTSFDAGTNPLFSLATSLGDGSVVINLVTTPPPTDVPEPASLALLASGLLGLGMVRRWKGV